MKKLNCPGSSCLVPFSASGRRGLGARNPASPCSSVSFAPSLRPVSARARRGLGARIPASPCSSVPFAPSLRFVSPRGRPSWRLAPREAFVFRRTTPTPAPFSRRGADQVGAWLPANPLSTVGSRQHRRLGPGRRGAWRRKNKGLRGGAHHVRTAVGALGPEDVVLGDERIRASGEWRTTSASPSAPWPRKTWCPATKE